VSAAHIPSELRESCLAWVETIRDQSEPGLGRFKYSQHMLRPYAVEATGHMPMILDALGALADYPHREAMVTFLLDQQDPETGQFRDPLIQPEDHVGGHHSWQHIWDHHTGVAAEALSLCKVEPRHPLPQSAHADLDTVDPREWTLSLDWTQPYLVSEHWMNAVMAYHRKHGLTPGRDTMPAIDAAFDTVDREIVNPATGHPDRWNEQSLGAGLGGIFKLLWAYVPCRRTPPHADKAVDSVLDLQGPTGDFAGEGNMCMNWDAVFIMRYLTGDLTRTHCKDAIRHASARLTDRLLTDYRKPDGAFSFLPDSCLPVHNSIRVSDPHLESDVLGTTMCLECVAINNAWQADEPSHSFADDSFGFTQD
jgi:hypothetical protein